MKREDLRPNVAVHGILPEAPVTVVKVQWYGDNALELTYKSPASRVSYEVFDEARLNVAEKGKPWSFDGDGKLFRLVAEPKEQSKKSCSKRGYSTIVTARCNTLSSSVGTPIGRVVLPSPLGM